MGDGMTDLDDAYFAMAAAQDDDDTARLRYYARLADGEMILMLADEARGANLTPKVFDLEDGPVVLIFDSEEKLGAFTGGVVPYAALPGRVIAQQLAGQGIGLAVNMGAASMMLFPPDAVDWLAQTLTQTPTEVQARPTAFHAPTGLPQTLLAALRAKLARSGGIAAGVLLAGVSYDDGRRGHVLAFLDAAPAAEPVLARAASEALIFSGVEAGEMDVTFLNTSDTGARAMAKVALRLDLIPATRAAVASPKPPGSDPDKPPILR
jgi:hypothetical protein